MDKKDGVTQSNPLVGQKHSIKYNPTFVAEVDKYIALSKEKSVVSSLKGFAEHLEVDEETIKAWANKRVKDANGNLTKEFARLEFLRAVKKLVSKQEEYPNLLKGNPGNDGGRPTKYDPKFVEEALKYIEEATGKKNCLVGIEEFALRIGVDDTTILNWANRKLKDENGKPAKKLARPEFFAAIKRIRAMQKYQLMNDGLYGGRDVSPTMAIFLLKANHSMVETSHMDVTTKGKELPVPILGGISNVPTNNSNS